MKKLLLATPAVALLATVPAFARDQISKELAGTWCLEKSGAACNRDDGLVVITPTTYADLTGEGMGCEVRRVKPQGNGSWEFDFACESEGFKINLKEKWTLRNGKLSISGKNRSGTYITRVVTDVKDGTNLPFGREWITLRPRPKDDDRPSSSWEHTSARWYPPILVTQLVRSC